MQNSESNFLSTILLLSVCFGFVLMFLYFTSARDIQIEADQKIINKVEEINRVYLRSREKGLFNYVRDMYSKICNKIKN